MNGAAPVFLVDTNVWLDNYLGFRPNHRASCEFLDEAVERGATLCHAATTAKDVHFFTCSTLKKAAREKGEAVDEAFALAANRLAWANLANMNEVSTLVGLDLSDFWVASKLSAFNGDIEDNLIMACAERAKADYIVTRDKGLLRRSTVCALAPEDATRRLSAVEGQQAAVALARARQLVRRAVERDAAVLHEHDAIHGVHTGQMVGDHDHRLARQRLEQVVQQRALGDGVEAYRGLVEDDKGRILVKCPGNGNFLGLPA